MTLAAELVAAATRGDVGSVRELTRPLSERDRRALLPEVRRAAAAMRREGTLWHGRTRYDATGLAVLACTTGAAAVVAHLRTWWTWGSSMDVPVVAMLLEREVGWLPDVLQRLADDPSRSGSGPGQWQLIEALRVALDAPRPNTPYYLLGLADRLTQSWRLIGDPVPPTLLDQLRADDSIVALLPDLLELPEAPLGSLQLLVIDRVNRTEERVDKPAEDTWPGVVGILCAEGRLSRDATMAACLRVLLRGGSTAQLTLLASLAPEPAEVAARVRDYGQLLADGTGPFAQHAQRALRGADDAGLLERDTLLTVSRAVLGRPEKGIVSTQLGWLDRVARRTAVAPDDVLLVVAEAFAHERTDVQERALAVVGKHLDRAGPGTRDELVGAAAALAPSLRRAAADLFGTPGEGAPAEPLPATGPGPRPSAPWPPVAADLPELAETCAALVEDLDDPVLLESALAGLARLRNADRPAFDAALAPVRHRVRTAGQGSDTESLAAMAAELELAGPVARLLGAALADDPPRGRVRGLLARVGVLSDLPPVPATPAGLAVLRFRELVSRLRAGECTELVATPTDATGLLDPDVLAARLARLAAVGREPWPEDLRQALLRLPRGRHESALASARLLSSRAGRALLRQLDRGHDEVGSVVVAHDLRARRRYDYPTRHPGPVTLVALAPLPEDAALPHQVLNLPDPGARADRSTRLRAAAGAGLWSAALPAHPEVLAAHALVALVDLPHARGSDRLRELVSTLPALAGPAGAAVPVAVVYCLAAEHAADRTAGVDAVVGLADRPDAAATGRTTGELLAQMVVNEGLVLGRVARALSDAVPAGPAAAAFVWRVAQAALPALLAAGTRDTARLLAVAADAAALAGARGRLDGLDGVTARGGSSRLVTEARRLQRVLTG